MLNWNSIRMVNVIKTPSMWTEKGVRALYFIERWIRGGPLVYSSRRTVTTSPVRQRALEPVGRYIWDHHLWRSKQLRNLKLGFPLGQALPSGVFFQNYNFLRKGTKLRFLNICTIILIKIENTSMSPVITMFGFISFIILILIYLFVFLGLHLWHMEVPRLGG